MEIRKIIRVEETESTNLLALELGTNGAAAGTVIVAETQTSGRGRLNREWYSPPGTGLYFSLILFPKLIAADLPKITLAAGVAVCEVIESEYQLVPGIKWPNDLLLDGKKIGGILCETGPVRGDQLSRDTLVVLGVGINVSIPEVDFPNVLRNKATSLQAYSGKKYAKESLFEAILVNLETNIVLLEQGKFEKILEKWRTRDALKEKILSWLDPAGNVVTGEALGIDDYGQYHIRDAQGAVHQVLSGDISPAES